MKRVCLLFLTIVLCLAVSACADGVGRWKVNADYVGDWTWFERSDAYEFSGSTATKNGEFATLHLNDDGTAVYKDKSGKWGYSKKNQTVTVKFEEETWKLKAEEIDGFTCLVKNGNSYSDGFYRVISERYDAVVATFTDVKWYDEFDFTRYIEFNKDGMLYLNNEKTEIKWEVVCLGPYDLVRIGDLKPIRFHSNDYSFLATILPDTRVWYSSNYAVVITPQNWKEYFDSNLENVFDITYKIASDEEDFPMESDLVQVEQQFTLKDSESYDIGSKITVEFVCGSDAELFEYQDSTQSVSQIHVYASPVEGEKVTIELEYADGVVSSSEEHFGDYYTNKIYLPDSGEIVQISGILFRSSKSIETE